MKGVGGCLVDSRQDGDDHSIERALRRHRGLHPGPHFACSERLVGVPVVVQIWEMKLLAGYREGVPVVM